jgi:hypothetical protein
MAKLDQARWWTIRPARNRKPSNYLCPLCGFRLHAMTDHMLIAPEGDADRRRHAHSECVAAARGQVRDEWLATQPRAPSRLRRLFGRAR